MEIKFKNREQFAKYWMRKGARRAPEYVEEWGTSQPDVAEHELSQHQEDTDQWYYWNGLIIELHTNSNGYLNRLYKLSDREKNAKSI